MILVFSKALTLHVLMCGSLSRELICLIHLNIEKHCPGCQTWNDCWHVSSLLGIMGTSADNYLSMVYLTLNKGFLMTLLNDLTYFD